MVHFATADLTKTDAYKLLTSAIVPRPIAWVSTLSAEGKRNIAPFSFFNGVSVMPPTLAFTVASGDDNRYHKDTYLNLSTTGECVVNIVTIETAEKMVITATEFPAEVDEFERAGLEWEASHNVEPPRVKQSPVQFECTLNQTVRLENDLGRSDLMICNILKIHVDDTLYLGDYKIDSIAMNAVGRMGGPNYVTAKDVFQLFRPPSEVQERDY